MNNKLLFLTALIPILLVLPLTNANAAVNSVTHKCIHDKISEALTHAGIIASGELSGGGGSFDAGMKMETEILAIVDNTTQDVESCIR